MPSDEEATLPHNDVLFVPIGTFRSYHTEPVWFTVIEIVAMVDPPELEAVIVYETDVCSMSGVPLITPVVVLSVSPEGRVGLTDQAVTVPITVGTLFMMTASLVYTAAMVEYDNAFGAARLTVIEINVDVDPPEFPAVMV